MKFGPVPVGEALGGIVAHSIREGAFVLRKGTMVTADHIAALGAHGIAEIVVARMDPTDLCENDAAGRLAHALAGPNVTVEPPATGRANLFSQVNGLLAIERQRIDAINAIDEAITVATLEPMKRVVPGEMIATVKIIPFAVEAALMAQATVQAQTGLRVLPFRTRKVGVISTLLPGLKASVVDKTLKVMSERLAALGCEAVAIDLRVPHEMAPIAAALAQLVAHGCELAIVFGASAITDRRDVIPAAIEASHGRIEHLGMPVDPGNLLLIGEMGGVPVIGAPGCARSPKENGFDWVLQRLLADLPVRKADIQAMGTGGLLMEIVSRPQPRAAVASAQEVPVAAIVLAAGRSTRMGSNKLLETLRGKALVRHVTEAAIASQAQPVIVVTGHQDAHVRAVLAGLDVTFVHNADYAEGMAGSLRAGIAAVPADCGAALVLLGDMPEVGAATIDRLVHVYAAQPDLRAVVPLAEGRRGNPVLLARGLFGAVECLTGDTGARKILSDDDPGIAEISLDDAAVLTDVDTPEALAALRQR